MKPILAAFAILSILTVTLFGQSIVDAIRGIEVSGTAERMVVPDELTFRITLSERMSGRNKIAIDQQEATLRSELEKIGVDVAKDLSIYDVSARYFRYRKIRDVLATQDYRLVIRDLEKVAQLQEIADKLNVSSLDLILAENTTIENIRQELRIEAIKAAKAKAESIMQAIGGKVGNAIYVKEVDDTPMPRPYYGLAYANAAANSAIAPLSFAPKKEKVIILARFEIK